MSEFVLLKPPHYSTKVYLRVVKAASDKHFSLVDEGYEEIMSGTHDEMHYECHKLEYNPDVIWLYCEKTLSAVCTTYKELEEILKIEPDYLKDKEFI